MDADRAHNIKDNSRKRSPRSKAQTRKGCDERNIMDITNRSTLEGYAFKISTIPDLPSAFPGMDRTRNLPGNFIRAGQRPIRTRENRYQGGVHRWELCTGKKRGLAVGKTKRGKGTKIMAIADASGFPVAACVESASPHEVKLVEKTIDSSFTPYAPDKLIGDKAYDSDPLDQKLMQERCIEMIAPHRMGRKKPKTQDGRKLRPYRRRWKVERLFAWLQNYRRLVVRYEYHVQNFLSMVQLGCAIILLRFF